MPRGRPALAKVEPVRAAPELQRFSERQKPSDFRTPTRQEWETMSLDDVHALIQSYHAAYKQGADILNQRTYDKIRESGTFKCIVCRKTKPITVDNHPNFVWNDHRRDPNTGILSSRYICSSDCYFRGSNSGQMTNVGTPGNVLK